MSLRSCDKPTALAGMFRIPPPPADAATSAFLSAKKSSKPTVQTLEDDIKKLNADIGSRIKSFVMLSKTEDEPKLAFLLDVLLVKGRRGASVSMEEEGLLRAYGVHAYFGLLRIHASGELAPSPARQHEAKFAKLDGLRAIYGIDDVDLSDPNKVKTKLLLWAADDVQALTGLALSARDF
jgi:hypothetical protein